MLPLLYFTASASGEVRASADGSFFPGGRDT